MILWYVWYLKIMSKFVDQEEHRKPDGVHVRRNEAVDNKFVELNDL